MDADLIFSGCLVVLTVLGVLIRFYRRKSLMGNRLIDPLDSPKLFPIKWPILYISSYLLIIIFGIIAFKIHFGVYWDIKQGKDDWIRLDASKFIVKDEIRTIPLTENTEGAEADFEYRVLNVLVEYQGKYFWAAGCNSSDSDQGLIYNGQFAEPWKYTESSGSEDGSGTVPTGLLQLPVW
eukprot:CAMPEP_0114981732 /NCGR_PEP_ID=MMETSP0216-20121206/5701_1 /TAXON_ID=223996 /ORGANISM="Protocruzia adherens, Strain Boccale" /LENGTH=179 /DNA_ID=CAMNT_0002343423 /DNA_START=205 /DNA_END=741 /DNA_ORIENTATION=-